MRTRSRNPFTTVTTAGLLLPVDLLTRVIEGDPDLPGLSPKDYHLRSGERLNEAASRAWNECLVSWKSFRKKFAALPASDAGTTQTRDEWLLPLFQELGYGRLQSKKAIEIESREYPISHGWENHVPVHLLSARLPLDRRTPGVSGAATRAPYSLLQEQLNRSSQHRWGFVSNGLKLFLLRDNAALARAANVEFDLEDMMDGEHYADFMLMFLLCHQSRVEIAEDGKPEGCWLEKWANQADSQGTRAREKLRDGVETAIKSLGAGFLTTKGNNDLRERLRTGEFSTQDYYRQLLRVVYRLLMLLVAEEKKTENGENLLHPTDTSPELRDRYARFYSVGRIRSLAYERRGTAHTDLYESLKVLFLKLRGGYEPLGIPGMGSFLFSDDSTPDLDDALLANQDLLDAFRNLCYTEDASGRGGSIRRPVDFGNLGSEELGSVYESLLELHPQIDTDEGPFTLGTAAGNERKTTGSYYTPTSLINCLLDSALDPVVNEAIDVADPAEAEQKLLDLKICDPACGSGHFLIAAAERMAMHLARLRTGDDQPNTLDVQHAKRDIIGRCIYGVDINPMAVELCRVSLWMEALEPGKPLSFLDHHIQCGNSLLGTTPRLLAEGTPDAAFKPIEGDDKKVCAELKKDNKRERKEYESGQGYLFAPYFKLGNLPATISQINIASDESLRDVAAKQQMYEKLVKGADYLNARLLADTWCAVFVWKKDNSDLGKLCPTERDFRKIEDSPHSILPHVKSEVRCLADQYQFFHWHLAFPDVFQLPEEGGEPENEQSGWNAGFDVALGNPPWERIKLQEKEWFAEREPKVAEAANAAARKRMIASLAEDSPELFAEFVDALRASNSGDQFLRQSNSFPKTGTGDINLFSVFAELAHRNIRPGGRVGILLPTAIATDTSNRMFFETLVEEQSLQCLYDFENRNGMFPSVHRSYKFCLLTLRNSPKQDEAEPAEFSFFALDVSDLHDPNRRFHLNSHDIAALNPSTKTCPIFRSRQDAELNRFIYRLHPRLIDAESFPHRRYMRLVDMGDHSQEMRFAWEPKEVPWDIVLFEAKMFHAFDHRYATYGGCSDEDVKSGRPQRSTLSEKSTSEWSTFPRYFVRASLSDELAAKFDDYRFQWLLLWRDIARSTDERTAIAAIAPRGLSARNTCPALAFGSFDEGVFLLGAFNSVPFDYVARQKVGGIHLNYKILSQLPLPEWIGNSRLARLLIPRVLELTYTAWDLESFARDGDYDGPPFCWDEERRFQIRCELDAAYFHLYLGSDEEWGADNPTLREMFPTPRDAVDYIMDTFPIVRRKDIARTQIKNATGEVTSEGTYITKDTILEIYDRMAEAIRTGHPYQTRLDPPPGPPTDAEGNFIPFSQWTDDLNTSHIHPPRVDRQRVEQGRLVLDMLLLLEAWKQPVSIAAIEPALLLMRNEAARKVLLTEELKPQDASDVQSEPRFISGIDRVYQAVETNGAIRLVGENGYELAKPELLTDASQADRDRAAEVIQAVARLGDLRTLGEVVAELTDERYEVTV